MTEDGKWKLVPMQSYDRLIAIAIGQTFSGDRETVNKDAASHSSYCFCIKVSHQ